MTAEARELLDDVLTTLHRPLSELVDEALLPVVLSEEIERKRYREERREGDRRFLPSFETSRLEVLVVDARLQVGGDLFSPSPVPKGGDEHETEPDDPGNDGQNGDYVSGHEWATC